MRGKPAVLYFMLACLLYSTWSAIDVVVQVVLTGRFERSPAVTVNTVLILLKKYARVG